MTSLNESPLEALGGLLEERRRYEGWLAQLEERRQASPAHVVDRVRSDYLARLTGVMTQLRGRAADLESSAVGLRERIASLEAEEGRRRDERAETELRSVVGEFDSEHAESAMAACDTAIAELSEERERHSAELARVIDVLGSIAAPTPQELAERAAEEEAEAMAAAAREREALAASRTAEMRVEDAVETPQEAQEAQAQDDRTEAPDIAASPVDTFDDDFDDDETPTLKIERGVMPANDAAQLDELAFLQSVVESRENEQGAAQRTASSEPSVRTAESGSDLLPPPVLAAPRRPATPLGSPPVSGNRDSFAGNSKGSTLTPGSMPSFFKDMPTEQVKTLKCQECGTMNYPTEWYCERCGGELAAM